MSNPNIVLICADMIAAKHFGCYGDQAKVTPNVDRLAESGVLFEQAYSAAPPCIPTRVSMMTGQYAHTHGKLAHIMMPVNPRPKLIPEILTQNGYNTAIVGKTHWWPPNDNLGAKQAYITIDNHLTPELGEDDAYVKFLKEKKIIDPNTPIAEMRRNDRLTANDELAKLLSPDNLPDECLKVNWTGDKACQLIEEFAKDDNKPFFIFCSFVEPHYGAPGSVKKEHLEKFRNIRLPKIIGREGELNDKPKVQQIMANHFKTSPVWQSKDDRIRVYASLNLVDNNIGKILYAIEQLKLKNNTIVIFLSDHGDLLHDHSLCNKDFPYESAVHMPFIIAGADMPSGQRRNHLVNQIDLFPTIMDLCNIEIDDNWNIEGRSILPILKNPQSSWRKNLFCEICETATDNISYTTKMLRTENWKYVYTLTNGYIVEEELYNLADDPDELYNLAHEQKNRDLLLQFRSEILRWLVATEVNRLHPVAENYYRVPKVDATWF